MKNETLLKELKCIRFEIHEKESKNIMLDELIEKIKMEMLIEDNKDLTSKQRLTKCLNHHKKMLKTTKPILAYCDNLQIEGKQIITDSFFLVALANEDILPIPSYKEKFDKYPSVDYLLHKTKTNINDSIYVNVGKLMNYAKLDNFINIKINNKICCLNVDTLKTFITHLNVKNSDNIALHYNSKSCDLNNNCYISPFYIEKKNGTIGLILPCCKTNTNVVELKDLI